MPSFDVVSRLDFQEIDNAIGNATREILNRYDFKGSDTSIERKDNDLTVVTDDELKLMFNSCSKFTSKVSNPSPLFGLLTDNFKLFFDN